MTKTSVKRENYITIQGWMISDLDLKGTELLVFALIYGFSQDEQTYFRGGLQYICDWAGGTKPTIMKILKSLEDKKLIIKKEIYNNNVKFCWYAINFHTIKEILTGMQNSFMGYENFFHGGMQDSFMGGMQNSLPNINNIDKDRLDNYSDNNSNKGVIGGKEKAKRLQCNQNVTEMLPDCNQKCDQECNQNVRQEYRDKSIEYRDKNLDNRDKSIDGFSNINITPPEQLNSGEKEYSQKRFSRPTIEEVRAYCLERKNNVDPEQFVDFYSAKGWKVGNSPMKDWKACVRTWEKRTPNPKPIKNNYSWNNNNSKNPPLDENGNIDYSCGGTFRGTIL